MTSKIVDVHTHVYPPSYISLLRSREKLPYIRIFPDAPNASRLIILPGEDDPSKPSTSRGRPIGPEYWDIKEKIYFMDKHKIDISVISLANPWLDFISPEAAAETAEKTNDEIEELCEKYPGRLYAFAALPLSASSPDIIVKEIARLKSLKHVRGVILGTSGLGKGLDDEALVPVFEALCENQLPIFLHPHYGLPSEAYGPKAGESGHVLPLALGFPMETTIAVTRMIVSGIFDQFKDLKVLLAHSGGTLPFLAGRIESCIQHDGHLKKAGKLEGRRSIWEILRSNIYLDGVVYSEVGIRAAIGASGGTRVMFGTDHPFFPPLVGDEKEWLSVRTNYDAISNAFGEAKEEAEAVLGRNAIQALNLED
ncbi:uracil-5-carboxylate decarboxylase [Aulographum hederae CBS 113979]|uniref:Uracil-5-carboxylate decarboxylase n=1 Tax=Aulographum hederae CBS 113979 TaxID=1176131 RepID=A0A6G1H165_9PEZI|nr:uracil-5-carboxylate decarboxylase [Aulographum hederae CBS 113979]